MQVIDRLTAIGPTVDHDAVSRRIESKLDGDLSQGVQQVPQQLGITLSRMRERNQLLLGNHQHMNGSLRVHVAKSQAPIVFMDDLGGDLTVNDPLEDRLGRHRGEPQRRVVGGQGIFREVTRWSRDSQTATNRPVVATLAPR